MSRVHIGFPALPVLAGRAPVLRRIRSALCAGLFGLSLAACQSAGPADVLSLDDSGPIAAQETTGNGATAITLLLPRTSGQPTRSQARDAYDGAKLAATELGGGAIRLVTIDTQGQPAIAKDFAMQSIAAGSKLILVAYDPAATAAIAAIPEAQRPPVIDLASVQSAGKGMFAFSSDEIDSALEGIRTATAAKQSKIVLVVPEGFSPTDMERLRSGIKRIKASLIDVVAYPRAENAVALKLAANKAAFQNATTLVIFGAGSAPAIVARAIAAGGYADKVTTLVGNSDWPQQIYAEPVLDGALVAMVDQGSLGELGSRYSAAVGRPLSLDASFSYDAVALASGLIRARGPDAVNSKSLLEKSGFRGVTGIFRFDANGKVERRHVIYRIEKGKLQRLTPEIEGF